MIILILGGTAILFCSLFFGLVPLNAHSFTSNKKLLSLSNCFAGGLFIAIGLIHILPEAHEALEGASEEHDSSLQHGGEPFPLSYFICLMSFSFILLIDKIIYNSTDLIEEDVDLSKSVLNNSFN